MAANGAAAQLSLLEQGRDCPLCFSLNEGRFELCECGVNLRFDAGDISLSWQGIGSTESILPRASQLRAGRWLLAAPEARFTCTAEACTFRVRAFNEETSVPSHGVALNGLREGHHIDASASVKAGTERGHLCRSPTVSIDAVTGVALHAPRGAEQTARDAHRAVRAQKVTLRGKKRAVGRVTELRPGDRLKIAATETNEPFVLHIFGR